MRSVTSPFLSVGLLAFVLLSYVACAQQGAMTDAMRQQESEMADESTAWNDELARWRSRHEEMRAWLAQHGSAGAGSADPALREHLAAMTAHEQGLADFQTQLDAHRVRLQEESAKPEMQRAGSHPETWGDHLRLKQSFEALRRSHDEVARRHAQWVDRLEPRAATP